MKKLMPLSIALPLTLCLLAAIMLASIGGCQRREAPKLIISDSTYYSEEQLEALYFEHKEDFHVISGIILESDSLLEYIKESHEGDMDISMTGDATFFSEEDWSKITMFFEETKVYMIMRSIKYGEDVVYFTFPMKAIGDQQVSTALFHITTQRAMEAYASSEDTFVEIDENWWIGTITIKMPSLVG